MGNGVVQNVHTADSDPRFSRQELQLVEALCEKKLARVFT